MSRHSERTLIVIGGHESTTGYKPILKEVARRVGSGKLVVTTVASHVPGGFAPYARVFRSLGVKHLFHLGIDSRADACSAQALNILKDATGVFFTGGDQLKITSHIGNTPVEERLHELYRSGGLIAGTSAMCQTMLISGEGNHSAKVDGSVNMAPGLGLLRRIIADQHFAQRGRIGRLIAAATSNPSVIGLGIDENTAVVVEGAKHFYVLGAGAVYVVDGTRISTTNMGESDSQEVLSVFDIGLHVLSQGDRFLLEMLRPQLREPVQVEPAAL